jgi:hypothetical protein
LTHREQLAAQIAHCRFSGNVLVIGHSWANGITSYGKPTRLEAELAENGMPAKVDTIAIDGLHIVDAAYAIEQIGKRMTTTRHGEKYPIVIVLIGMNDVPHGEPEAVAKGMAALYHQAESLGTFVFLPNIHPYERLMDKISRINELLILNSDKPGGVPLNRQPDFEIFSAERGDFRLHPKEGYGPAITELTRWLTLTKQAGIWEPPKRPEERRLLAH